MNTTTRREFLRWGTTSLAVAAAAPHLLAAEDKPARKRPNLKGIMWGTIGAKGSVLEKMQAVKAAGFEAFEMNSHMDQAEVLKARAEVGLPIVSVCNDRHWAKPLSHSDAAVREEGFAALQQTLRDAKAYGTDSILLVPGVVNKEATFEQCWERSIVEIRRALPLAAELGVRISIENVWNNFITTPDMAVKYVDEINSPWVKWHFDVGNIIRYGDPIEWIKALGKRISRIHVKEYSRDRAMRSGDVWKGFGAPLLEGANNWPGVMKALDEIGYTGPLITEQGGSLESLSQALDRIIAA
jgi:hexulose-6-phosphate isomerase